MSKHSKKRIQNVILVLCLFCLVAFALVKIYIDRNNFPDVKNVSVATNDDEISVEWKSPLFGKVKKVRVVMSGNDELEEFVLPAYAGHFSYKNGVSGCVYRIYVTGIYKDGSRGETKYFDRMFLDFDELPELPFITLNTSDGKDPSLKYVESPDDLWGGTITDNEYVSGLFSMDETGAGTKSSEMEIRVRGNSSAVISGKKPYRIKLKNALDLLDLGDGYSDKDWILLNVGTDLNAYLGMYVSTYCGMEWQPRMRFVNVFMNGDYKGLYMLSESIERSEDKCNVSDGGYIFENDGYWWSADGLYFRTKKQLKQLGYTISYPKITDPSDERMKKLKDYMQNIEDLFADNDDKVFDYIDVKSFAEWTLIKDIMGVYDFGGSNMFFYLYELNEADPTKYKLKMGPTWDFDSAFMVNADNWSLQHYWEGNFTNYLWDYEEFRDAYADVWNDISDDFCDDVSAYLSELIESQGKAIDKSRKLDAARWRNRSQTVEDEVSHIDMWLTEHMKWIDGMFGR